MVITTVTIILVLFAVAMAIPCIVVGVECLIAVIGGADRRAALEHRGNQRLAVLIPAHNEQTCIAATLSTVLPQLRAGDRVLVVADNCTDDTAEQARRAGAQVVVRHDPHRRGKGYALAYGVQALAADPPQVVVVIDADTRLLPGSIDALRDHVSLSEAPAQAVNLLEPPSNPGARDRLSALAFMVRNLARPLGLSRLGLPCPLFGTGMALPWQALRDAPLASGNIVEDMQLGIDLAIGGHPARLCPEARVMGVLPSGSTDARAQRTRWEHGHVRTLLTQVPRLLGQALRQRRLDLLAMAVDLSVPPLALLVLIWTVLSSLSFLLWWLAGRWEAAAICGCGAASLLCGVLPAWWRFARQLIPASSLLAVPLYIVWKLPMYLRLFVSPQRQWIRTARPGTAG
ncbi:glycosyltransferase family 2 protein [Fontivita pretiosa]|uniref:glycosyltransferase family 2 protein n=1 Tax=Fontivita pretiosa TaxID=2989684 RepID=UPI003D185595